MPERLAIHGGSKAVPEGMVQPWPPIDDSDREMVLASLQGNSHAFGPNCEAFQQEFAAWNGNKYALTTNSGTAALHMCVAACDCGEGDEVVVTAYSWSSSATCILQHNAIPVFVDIDFNTINVNIDKIEEAITPRTRAILAVHLHGLPVAMDRVLEIASRYNLRVIEDACQAHGARYKGRNVGTWGDCAALSCNQNKLLCSGEGGVFVTDDEDLLKKAQAVWSFGETRAPSENRDYHSYALGWMYRSNDLTAAFARAQLRKLDGYLQRLKENVAVFEQGIQGLPGLILPTVPEDCEPDWYNYVLRFDRDAIGRKGSPSAFRDKIVEALQAEGAPNMVWQRFILPEMTVFQAKNAYGKGSPWSSPHAGEVDYSPENFPVAKRHCDTHTCIVTPLRPPNGPEVAQALAGGVRKVMENIDRIDA